MFDSQDVGIGLWPGEGTEDFEAEDQLAYELTCRSWADGWIAPDQHFLPGDLESIPVGGYLAAIMGSVDASKLNGHDAVRLMQTEARLASHHEARKLETMAEVAFSPAGDADSPVERGFDEVEYVAAEIAAALTLTRRASESLLNLAVSLSGRIHRVRTAFSEGAIDAAKVRVFDQQLGHLPEETVDAVLDRVLDDASGLTTGQLRARVARFVLEADPDGSKSSFEEGLQARKVATYPNPDMTGNFNISSADPTAVAAARENVETVARQVKAISSDGRTLDEMRADVALDLLAGKCGCGTNTGCGGGRTNITVSAATLARLSDEPGEIDGYGPVFAEIARKTVRESVDGEWRFVVTDNGRPVATGTLARRPTAAQQRQVTANYPKCVHPGCREDAWDCDIDHRYPHGRGGATCVHNLAPLCRHHHQTKDDGGWKLQRLENGNHRWTSPLGHTYMRRRGPPD